MNIDSKFWAWHLLVAAFAVLAIGLTNAMPERAKPKEIFLVPPAHLSLFTFGYRENVSDMIWLRLIQDIDHCDTEKVFDETWQTELCGTQKGWVYHMLDAITTLTPEFRLPYALGAIILSVLVNDKPGAAEIFERAIKQFPTDWPIQYRAAYHYLYEMKNYDRAAELLMMAGKNGAPAWVYSLASQLYTKAGQKAVAKSVLLDMLEQTKGDDRWRERLERRLEQIDAMPDDGESKPTPEAGVSN